jgi:hypothetical protein
VGLEFVVVVAAIEPVTRMIALFVVNFQVMI